MKTFNRSINTNTTSGSSTKDSHLRNKLYNAQIPYDPQKMELWKESTIMKEHLKKEFQFFQKYLKDDIKESEEYKSFQPKILFIESELHKKRYYFEPCFLFQNDSLRPIIQFGPWVRLFFFTKVFFFNFFLLDFGLEL